MAKRMMHFGILLIVFLMCLEAVQGSGPGPESTPAPPPLPRSTFCDIIVECDIYVYDGPAGQTVPVQGALIEPASSQCPYDSWSTGADGWADLFYPNYSFDMDIIISHANYYETEYTINSMDCPVYIGLSPVGTATPTPPCINNGDANLNGELTAEDAQFSFLIALGSMSPDWDQWCAADCNGSGAVTSGDAQQIFLTIFNLDQCVDPL